MPRIYRFHTGIVALLAVLTLASVLLLAPSLVAANPAPQKAGANRQNPLTSVRPSTKAVAGARSEQPASPYTLSGDKHNTPGVDTTVFSTTNELGDTSGWEFIDTFGGDTTLYAHGAGYGVYGEGDSAGVEGSSSDGDGVQGFSNSNDTGAGVYGENVSGAGVWGYGSTGVYGDGNIIGVQGQTASNSSGSYAGNFIATAGIGAYGQSDSNEGVYGKSVSGYGVLGVSSGSYGVYGKSTNSYGVLGVTGLSVGVRGVSSSYFGFYAGSSTGTGGYGYTHSGQAGFRAHNDTTTAGHYGIISDGSVLVNGDITCTGSCLAAMGVKTADGEHLFYSEGTAGSSLSDSGVATLKGGSAVIKIDPLFAQGANVNGDYQVLVTPYSFASPGLAVGNLGAGSFEVREINGGKGSYKFAWRITAPRRGAENVRLEKITPVPPEAPIHDGLDK